MPAEGVILELGTQADTDRLQDRSTGGRGGGSVLGVHSGRNVYRPFFPPALLSGASSWVEGLVSNARPILSHTVLTVKAQLAIVPWMSLVFRPPLLSGTFPPLDVDAARNQRSLQVTMEEKCINKQIVDVSTTRNVTKSCPLGS